MLFATLIFKEMMGPVSLGYWQVFKDPNKLISPGEMDKTYAKNV
jgi:hypothetical protein